MTRTTAQEFVAERRTHYIRTFNTPGGRQVMLDLAKFCRANETTFHPDPRVHAALEGRREVWLRIRQHLDLTEDELCALFGASHPLQPPKE